jgi:pyruvate,water dikinase
MTAPGIQWSGRRRVDLRGFASVVTSSLTEGEGPSGSLGAAAYLVVGRDSLNFNARLAYHFAMVDSVVGEVPETNDVSFRFWGGGAGQAQRDLRAVFLARVLEGAAFTVERRGDLVTARLRRAPARASEEGLELLGRLMGCARQLDMLLRSDDQVTELVESFLEGRYERFA